MIKSTLWVLLISVLWMQCKSSQVVTEDNLLLEMRRTRCFGNCPAYSVKIYKSGRVEYNGEKFVPLEGPKEFVLQKKDLQLINESMEEINFFSLRDRYYKEVTDLPTTYITYHKNGNVKEVMDYYGAPEKLLKLENTIQDIIFRYLE